MSQAIGATQTICDAPELKTATAADSPREAAKAYAAVFPRATADELNELAGHPDPGVALRAAWERVRRTVPEEFHREPQRPPASALYRFLGFVEGRVGTRPPSLWDDRILDTWGHQRSCLGFMRAGNHGPYRKNDCGLWAPQDTLLTGTETQLRVVIGTRSFRIPAGVVARARNSELIDRVNVLLTATRCYVALHSHRCDPYELICFAHGSGTQLWSVRVWASGALTAGGKHCEHFVVLEEQQRSIIVYGIGSDTAYIEAFNWEDGGNLFRFSTHVMETPSF